MRWRVVRLGCAASLILMLAFIVYGSLTPFAFDPMSAGAVLKGLRDLLDGPWHIPSRRDLIANILLFVPVGLMAPVVLRGRDYGWMPRAFLVLAAAMTLSVTLEVMQQFLPGRISSIADVAAHTLGTMMGLTARYILTRIVISVRRSTESDTRKSPAD